MSGPAGCLLTVPTPILVLLAWQLVSNSMLGSAGCLLTVLSLILVLLASWQKVSANFIPGPTRCLLTSAFSLTLVLLGFIACGWFHSRSSWVPSDCCPHFHSDSVGLQEVSDFMSDLAECLLTVLTLTLVVLTWQQVRSHFIPGPAGSFWLSFSIPPWLCWLNRKWVISCQTQLGATFWLSSLNSGHIGLTASEWFHARFSWVPSKGHPHSYSGPAGSTACECIQLSAFQLSHSWHSGPVGLTGSEWFHARSSWVPSDSPHSHCDPAGLSASKWFHARFSQCPFWLSSFSWWLWSCWLDSLWVISCQVQLSAFW